MNKISILLILLAITGCSTCKMPSEIKVVQAIKPSDKRLSCNALSDEILDTRALISYTSSQVDYALAYSSSQPSCYPKVELYAERARDAAMNRLDYLMMLYDHKKCSKESSKISEKKLSPNKDGLIETVIPITNN